MVGPAATLAAVLYGAKALAALWAIGLFFVFFVGGNRSQRDDRASKLILAVTLSAALPTIGLAARWDTEGWGLLAWGFPWVSMTGFVLVVGGLVLHATAMVTLGSQWSPSVVITEDHRLVERGVYRWVRHPIYAAILLELLGFAMAVANLPALFLLLVPNVAALAYRIGVEEAALADHFGPAWADYIRRTKRLVPGVY